MTTEGDNLDQQWANDLLAQSQRALEVNKKEQDPLDYDIPGFTSSIHRSFKQWLKDNLRLIVIIAASLVVVGSIGYTMNNPGTVGPSFVDRVVEQQAPVATSTDANALDPNGLTPGYLCDWWYDQMFTPDEDVDRDQFVRDCSGDEDLVTAIREILD